MLVNDEPDGRYDRVDRDKGFYRMTVYRYLDTVCRISVQGTVVVKRKEGSGVRSHQVSPGPIYQSRISDYRCGRWIVATPMMDAGERECDEKGRT